MILPTEEEFRAWQDHPVTQFVAEAYRIKAEAQRAAWGRMLDYPATSPQALQSERDVLKTREDAYNAFLETTFADYLAVVDPQAHAVRREALAVKIPRRA